MASALSAAKGQRKKRWKKAFLHLLPAASFAVFFVWDAAAKAHEPANLAFPLNGITCRGVIDALFHNIPERSAGIIRAFLHRFFLTPEFDFHVCRITLGGLILLLSLILLVAILFYRHKYQRGKLFLLSGVTLTGIFLWSFSLMCLYILVFIPYEGQHLASFWRYEKTCIAGMGILLAGVLFYCPQKMYRNLLLGCSFLLVPSFLSSYAKPPSSSDRYLNEIANQLLLQEKRDSKVWLIHQGTFGKTSWIFWYDHPEDQESARSELRPWNLGDPESTGDRWRRKISQDEFLQIMEKKDFCYIAEADRILKEEYGDIFADRNDITGGRLYRLENGKMIKVPLKRFIFDFKKTSFLLPILTLSRNAETRWSGGRGQDVTLKSGGVMVLKTHPLEFDQPLKRFTLHCQMSKDTADMVLMNGNYLLTFFGSRQLQEGRISWNFDSPVKLDNLRFVFRNNGKANCRIRIRKIEFDFSAR